MPHPLTRRSLLRGSIAGAGLFALGGTAACGSNSATSASSTTTSAGSVGSSSAAASSSTSSSTAAALSAVTYQLSWTHSVQFGGTYLAKNQGLFEKLGLDVTLAPGGPNVAGDANTVSGTAMMNISGGDGVARSNAEGAGLVIIGRQYQKSPGTILSLADNPLKTPESLVGKSVGVAGTDTPALDAFLTINNLTKDQVTFVPTQYDPAVLTAGQVDGIFCFYNDLPVALQSQNIEGYSMLLADFGYNPMAQTYTVLKSSLEDATKRKQIVDLFRGDAQGWQLYKEDPEAAAQTTIDMYPDAGLDLANQKLQAGVQVDIMYSSVTDANGFGWFTEQDVADNIELYKLLGIEGVDESLWDHSILDEVYANGPTA